MLGEGGGRGVVEAGGTLKIRKKEKLCYLSNFEKSVFGCCCFGFCFVGGGGWKLKESLKHPITQYKDNEKNLMLINKLETLLNTDL